MYTNSKPIRAGFPYGIAATRKDAMHCVFTAKLMAWRWLLALILTVMPMFSQPVVVFDHFGNIGKQPYRQELATSHNVMQELQERQSDVAALNLSPWMMAHSEAAQSRAAALNIRTDETAKKPCIRVADARRRMEAVYQQVTDRIDAVVNLRGKDALGGFYDEYNAHATEYKNTLAQHLGRVHGKNQNNNTFSNTENA